MRSRDDCSQPRPRKASGSRGRSRRARAETGGGAEVAGRTRGSGQYQQGVAVAIGGDGAHFQEMARASRPWSRAGRLLRLQKVTRPLALRRGQRLAVHVSEHEHGAACGILHDGRQQPVALVPVEPVDVVQILTSMPSPRSAALEIGNRDLAGVKHAGGERRVDPRLAEHLREMLVCGPAPPEATSGTRQTRAHGAQLLDVVALAHAVARHAIEHDLAGAAPLRLEHPIQGAARGVAAALPRRR